MKGRDEMNIKIKKKLTFALALILVTSPIIAYGEGNLEIMPINAEVVQPINEEVVPIKAEEELPNYIEFNGKITSVDISEGRVSILAENNLEDALDKLVAHLSEDVIILDEETMDFISKEDLKEGMEVSIYYDKETIMMLSYPPQLGPDAVIVRSDEVDLNIKIDKFDEELTSEDNSLKLNIDEDVVLVDLEGEKLEKEDLANKDLIVFYTASTRSIPAQTTPKKVIAIRNHEVKLFDYFNLNEDKLELDNKMYKNDDNELMVPLREVAEALDFKVEWIDETRTVKLAKDDHTASFTIGVDEYQYYDMLFDLGTAPELIESITYVPLSFVQRILLAGLEVSMDGVIELTKY